MRFRTSILFPLPLQNNVVVSSPVPSQVSIAAESNGDTKNAARGVRLVVLDIMEFEIARAKMLSKTLRMAEHSEVAFAYLCHATVGSGLEHITRDEGSLRRLHCLVPQYPRLPIMPYVLDIL